VSWLFDFVTDLFWVEFVSRMSRGKPWWVWALWALSPIIVIGLLLGTLWLVLR
jgi:hypothetical protein